MKTFGLLKAALEEEIGDTVAFRSVAVRIFLRTGVNLAEITDNDASDPSKLEEVKSAARDMGYLS